MAIAERGKPRLVSDSEGTTSGDRAKECSAISANVIATSFALIGFIAALVVGWAAGNPTLTILWRAWGALLVCLIVGKIVGAVAQHTIEKNIESYKLANPIPPDPLSEALAADAADESPIEVEIEKPVTSRSAA